MLSRTDYAFLKTRDNEIWRFYIDGYRQLTPDGLSKGSLLFDVKEKGYMNAMLAAHQYMIATLKNPLTPQLLIDFHKIAIGKVENTDNEELDIFRDNLPGDFGIVTNINTSGNHDLLGNASFEGLKQVLQEIIDTNNENKFEFHVRTPTQTDYNFLDKVIEKFKSEGIDSAAKYLEEAIKTRGAIFYSPKKPHIEINKKVQNYIDTYHKAISAATTQDQKLEAIIKLVQSIERLHPFTDGNCRTLAMLLLNRELINNNIPPTMLENPNRFDFFSVNELKNEIKHGQTYAQSFSSEIANLPAFKSFYDYLKAEKTEGFINNLMSFFNREPTNQQLYNFLLNIKDDSYAAALTKVQTAPVVHQEETTKLMMNLATEIKNHRSIEEAKPGPSSTK